MGGQASSTRRKSVPHARRSTVVHHRPSRQSHGNIYLGPPNTESLLRASLNTPPVAVDTQQYYFPYDAVNDEYGEWDGEGYFFTKAIVENESQDDREKRITQSKMRHEEAPPPLPPVDTKTTAEVEIEQTNLKPVAEETLPEGNEPQEESVMESEEESEPEQEVISPEIRIKQRNRRRLALIFGNNDYASPHQLHSCCKDAEDMATTLKSLGFDCTVVLNAKQRTMMYHEKRFSEKIRSGDCVLFYFSGHGMEDKGKNYLIPIHRTDLKIVPEYDFICLDDLIKRLSERKDVVNILILDACRGDEKNVASARSKLKFNERPGAFGKSLSNRLDTPEGGDYVIVYACEPGQVCMASNPGENSTFTAALLKCIDQEDKSMDIMMKDVRKELRKMTNGKQKPWIYSCLSEKFFFKP